MWFQLFIVLSCLISVSVNFSTFLVIGKTSPVTYQVLGHLKTCLVLAFGYVLLRDPFSWRNIFGILIAVIGMLLYSYYCTVENQQKASEASTKLPEVNYILSSCMYINNLLFGKLHSLSSYLHSFVIFFFCWVWVELRAYLCSYNLYSLFIHFMLSFFMVLGQGKWIWSFSWCGKWKWNFSWWYCSKSYCMEFE